MRLAVSRGNESYNTNSPSASPLAVVRNYSHMCVCAAYSSRSYCSKVAFIRSELLIVWLLFEVIYGSCLLSGDGLFNFRFPVVIVHML